MSRVQSHGPQHAQQWVPADTASLQCEALGACPLPSRRAQTFIYQVCHSLQLCHAQQYRTESCIVMSRHALTVRTSALRQQSNRAQRLTTRASSGEDSVKGAVGNPGDHPGMSSPASASQVGCTHNICGYHAHAQNQMSLACQCRGLQLQQHLHLVSKAYKIYQSIPKSL